MTSTTEPVYLRFENVVPPHYKFYEVEVDLCLFYPKRLIRRWGRIGTRRPRCLKMVMETLDELQRQVDALARRRQQHGYRQVAEIRMPMIGESAA
jgi:predicted DNA-binding WGR domain protein